MKTDASFGPPLTAEQQDEVADAYLHGMSFQSIASTFRIHVKHINSTLDARGITRMSKHARSRSKAIITQLEIPGSLLLILPELRTLPRFRQTEILTAYQASAPAEQLHQMFKDAQQWPQ